MMNENSAPQERIFSVIAEGERFELSMGCPMLVFKTSALDHSATPPCTSFCTTKTLYTPAFEGMYWGGYNACMNKRHSPQSGFSLMELLVVIAIIAILASVILASFSGTEGKARDTRRMQDISSIQKALALYLVSHGIYPVETSTTTITGSDPMMAALIAEGHLPSVPKDPASPASDYSYVSNSYGNNYWLSFCLETDQIRNYSQGCGNTVRP